MKKITLFILTLLFTSTFLQAQQDAQFSQYMFNQLFLNPAVAGLDQENINFGLIHRSQWAGYSATFDDGSAPVTQVFRMSAPIRVANSGIGLHLVRDQLGPLTNLELMLSYAYHHKLQNGNTLSFGIRGGIYNQTIDSRMVTADTEPQSVESKQAWFDSHTDTRPIYVVEDNEQVVAWLSFKSFYGRPAYTGTVEIAIYVDSNQRGKQIGQTLLQFAESLAPKLHIKSLLAFIFSHNTPSMRLFIKHDFAVWGELPNVAKMDNKEYSLTILGKRIGENKV